MLNLGSESTLLLAGVREMVETVDVTESEPIPIRVPLSDAETPTSRGEVKAT